MAKRTAEKTRVAQAINIADALSEVVRGRNVEMDYVRETLEAGLLSAARKKYGSDENLKVKVDPRNGSISMSATRRVVEEVADPVAEITTEELSERGLKGKVGDEVEVPIDITEFGRNAIGLVKQILVQKVREAERERVYNEYINRVGEVVVGSVQQVDKGYVIVNLGRAEGAIPPREQIHREKYRLGERVRCLILEVQRAGKGPPVILSRTHPDLLRRLFELEVPEIFEKIIEIKSVAREPGERSKIAVSSADERIDPVGACVGMRGVRVQSIVRELAGERIDVIAYSGHPETYVTRALAPAKVSQIMTTNEAENEMTVVVADDQLSLAIGKQGQNARLAAKLTGWKINILAESEYEEERKRRRKQKLPIYNLEGLGDVMAKKLMEKGFETVQNLAEADTEVLMEIEGIGPKKAEKLILSAKEYLEELKRRKPEEEENEEEAEEMEEEELEEEEESEEMEKEEKNKGAVEAEKTEEEEK